MGVPQRRLAIGHFVWDFGRLVSSTKTRIEGETKQKNAVQGSEMFVKVQMVFKWRTATRRRLA